MKENVLLKLGKVLPQLNVPNRKRYKDKKMDEFDYQEHHRQN